MKLSPTDPHPSLVMINPHIPGLKAVRQDGRSRAETLWKVVVGGKEDQYQSAIRIVPGGPDVVSDLDGDGRYEVLASITNEHGDRSQHLVVFDAATGRRLAEAGDERVLSVDDLDGDGRPEVLLQGAARLRLARWDGRGFIELWHGDGVEPLLRPLPSEGSLTPHLGREHARLARVAGLGPLPVPVPRRRQRLPARGKPGRPRQAGRHPRGTRERWRGRDPQAERVTWDGKAVVTRKGSTEVYRYEPPAPQTYLAPPPLVADLGGSRQVLVRDATGKFLLVLPRRAGRPACSSTARSSGSRPTSTRRAPGPRSATWTATARTRSWRRSRAPTGSPSARSSMRTGRLKRRLDLEPGTTLLNRGPTGSLGPGRGRWIVLRMFDARRGYRRPLVVAFDGKTGEKLWARDHYASYGPNPVVFAAHLPTAVHDLDGDGADDWLVCSENFYGVISVKDNRDLVGPVVLSDALPGHWTAYSYPSLGKVRSTGEPGVLHNNSYALGLDHRPARQAALAPRDDPRHGGHLGDPGRRRWRRRERVRARPAGRLDPLLRRRGPRDRAARPARPGRRSRTTRIRRAIPAAGRST